MDVMDTITFRGYMVLHEFEGMGVRIEYIHDVL